MEHISLSGPLMAAFSEQRPRLVRLCSRLSGAPDAAEDLAQETLIEAWRHADRLRDASGAGAWLSAIARNVCLRHRRRMGREASRLTHDAALPELPDSVDLELELERNELASLLDRALDLLPPQTRQVLLQRWVEDLPLEEIAGRLGVSSNVVAVRVHRGKLALRDLLAGELHDEAASLGLLEAGWTQTSVWCLVCGDQRMEGQLDSARGELLLRCPTCSTREPGYIDTQTHLPELLTGVRTYRTALRRLQDWQTAFYQGVVCGAEVPCPQCGATSIVETGAPADAPAWQQRTPGLRHTCPRCREDSWQGLAGLVLAHPTGRAFMSTHRRARYLPQREVSVEGRPGLLLSTEARGGAAQLDAVFDAESYALLLVEEVRRG